MNTLNAEMSYVYGLFLTDGHLSEEPRNRGRLSLEINHKDADIIEKIKPILPCNSSASERTRVTNFGYSKTIALKIYDAKFRSNLIDIGFPVGKKSEIVDIPNAIYSEKDFWRGVFDGDGSLGLTASGIPFISLTTKSDKLATAFKQFALINFGITISSKRNSRDSVFNLMLSKENAAVVASKLYYDGCLSLNRKYNKANDVKSWVRPQSMRKVSSRKWTQEEICALKTLPLEEVCKLTGRTASSVINKIQKIYSKSKELKT